ncbi:hypothetical protein C7M84_006424 [Penaeus vannamei]|uniref:Uncharacterized protein n=1 Tax=Penaeus vannamei TaxID=6689 RepID=A0A3R7M7I6_PENVA|nr:hypothetical protein C7M84_006424 [Penaeus vannamei]
MFLLPLPPASLSLLSIPSSSPVLSFSLICNPKMLPLSPLSFSVYRSLPSSVPHFLIRLPSSFLICSSSSFPNPSTIHLFSPSVSLLFSLLLLPPLLITAYCPLLPLSLCSLPHSPMFLVSSFPFLIAFTPLFRHSFLNHFSSSLFASSAPSSLLPPPACSQYPVFPCLPRLFPLAPFILIDVLFSSPVLSLFAESLQFPRTSPSPVQESSSVHFPLPTPSSLVPIPPSITYPFSPLFALPLSIPHFLLRPPFPLLADPYYPLIPNPFTLSQFLFRPPFPLSRLSTPRLLDTIASLPPYSVCSLFHISPFPLRVCPVPLLLISRSPIPHPLQAPFCALVPSPLPSPLFPLPPFPARLIRLVPSSLFPCPFPIPHFLFRLPSPFSSLLIPYSPSPFPSQSPSSPPIPILHPFPSSSSASLPLSPFPPLLIPYPLLPLFPSCSSLALLATDSFNIRLSLTGLPNSPL